MMMQAIQGRGAGRSGAALATLFSVVLLTAAERPKGEKHADEVRQFPHGSYIYQVAFSPDGKMVLTDDQLWETRTGKKLRTLPHLPALAHRATRHHFWLAFSPDSRHVAIHLFDDIVLLEAATGKEVWRARHPPGHTKYRRGVPRLAFTPDGKHLLSARNDDGLIRVWSAVTGKEVRRFPFDDIEKAGQWGANI